MYSIRRIYGTGTAGTLVQTDTSLKYSLKTQQKIIFIPRYHPCEGYLQAYT